MYYHFSKNIVFRLFYLTAELRIILGVVVNFLRAFLHEVLFALFFLYGFQLTSRACESSQIFEKEIITLQILGHCMSGKTAH